MLLTADEVGKVPIVVVKDGLEVFDKFLNHIFHHCTIIVISFPFAKQNLRKWWRQFFDLWGTFCFASVPNDSRSPPSASDQIWRLICKKSDKLELPCGESRRWPPGLPSQMWPTDSSQSQEHCPYSPCGSAQFAPLSCCGRSVWMGDPIVQGSQRISCAPTMMHIWKLWTVHLVLWGDVVASMHPTVVFCISWIDPIELATETWSNYLC